MRVNSNFFHSDFCLSPNSTSALFSNPKPLAKLFPMSQYYNPGRTTGLFDPLSNKPFALSRSKLEQFMNCQRCFYLDRRMGIGQPPGFPFTLNNTVDSLLKKEFDTYRLEGKAHPMLEGSEIDAIPFRHEKLSEWRDARRAGIRFEHAASRFEVHGGIDDVWIDPQGQLVIVDYKATSKTGQVSLDAPWQISYKRQMEVYQWLFRQNGFSVSPRGVFVYCNADQSKEGFFGRLDFKISILPYTGSTDWIEPKLIEARACLSLPKMPPMAKDCDYCRYRKAIKDATQA